MTGMADGRRLRSDAGFSVAEVVISAAILFFVLTAMLGLVGASQQMTVSAKQRTAVTNAMAQYIDQVRSLPYAALAYEPTGRVKASESVAVAGYTIDFTARVVYPDGYLGRYTAVYLTASCSTNGRSYKTSAVVNIKNPEDDTTTASDPNKPIVEFITPTPDSDAVLAGKFVRLPVYNTARIAVRADSPQDLITEVRYNVAGVMVRNDKANGMDALFPFTPGEQSVTIPPFTWDTEQPGVGDGFRYVEAIAKDNEGREGRAQRRFIIDNLPPGPPGAPIGTAQTSSTGKIQFTAAADPVPAAGAPPQSYASRYSYNLYREPGTVGAYADWPKVGDGMVYTAPTYAAAISVGGTITANVALSPFSRYRADVIAGSPVEFNTTDVRHTGTPWISPPEITSSEVTKTTCVTNYIVNGSEKYTKYQVVAYMSKPTFPCYPATGSSYELLYRVDGTTIWNRAATLPTDWLVTNVGDFLKVTYTFYDPAASKALHFKIGIGVTPLGAGGGTVSPLVYTDGFGKTALDGSRYDFIASPVTQLVGDRTW